MLVGWPAWEYMYKEQWIENAYNHPLIAGFYIAFVIAMILLGNFGYMLGHYCYQKKKDNFVILGLIVSLVLTFLPFLLNWGKWLKIGTYEEIMAGESYSFWSAPFFYGWLGIISFMVLAGVLSGIWFINKSKKLSNQH